MDGALNYIKKKTSWNSESLQPGLTGMQEIIPQKLIIQPIQINDFDAQKSNKNLK